jgi:hypothetical protein
MENYCYIVVERGQFSPRATPFLFGGVYVKHQAGWVWRGYPSSQRALQG